ncbi:hypothetical protein [Hyalangium rubrum]|uniref:Uncharacterized protein n=1 Tax=Hyalangium rubrum TaxID=3103134 RepID=A0ABU5H1G4_9BACT|nr:hypothetical protein [Hyalangium sp. s54d21]MDY7226974.1 hypothetical protein [Hyalangium sp. s54d21]
MGVGPVDSSIKNIGSQPLPPKKIEAPAPKQAQPSNVSTKGTAKDKTAPTPAQTPDSYVKGTAKEKTQVELNPQQAETDFNTRTQQVETDLKDGKIGQAVDTMLNSEGDNVKLKLSGEAKVLIPGTPVKAGAESGTEVKVTQGKDGTYEVSVLSEGKLKGSLSTEDLRASNAAGGQQAGADGSATVEVGAGFAPKFTFKSKEDLDRGLKAIAQWGAGNPTAGALSAGVDVASKVNSKITGGLAGLAHAVPGLDGVGDKLDQASATFKKVDDAVGLDQDAMKFLTQNMTGFQVKGGTAVELAGKLNLPQGELEGKFKGGVETSLDITFGEDGKPPSVKVEQSGNIDLSAAGKAGTLVGPQGEGKSNAKVSTTTEFELGGNLDPAKLLKGDVSAGVDPKLVSSKAAIELGVGGKLGAHATAPGVATAKADAGLSGKVTLSAHTRDLLQALDSEALAGLAAYDPSALLKNLGDTKLTVDRELSGTATLSGKVGFDSRVLNVGVTGEAAWTDVLRKDPQPKELTGSQLGEELKGMPSDFASLLATLEPQEFRAWTRQALVG